MTVPAVLLLATVGLGFAVYAATLAAKHHYHPAIRREVAFVLALTVVASCWGAALLFAVLGDRP